MIGVGAEVNGGSTYEAQERRAEVLALDEVHGLPLDGALGVPELRAGAERVRDTHAALGIAQCAADSHR